MEGAGGGLYLRFWGTRGSIPTPGTGTTRYGGNTSCVSVEPAVPADGAAPGTELFVLDSGSGIRLLGLDVLRRKRLPLTAHLLLTHTHWDHIQGFPFFAPAFIPGNTITVYGAAGSDEDLAGALAGQMLHRNFPVSLHQLGARIAFTTVAPGAQQIGPATVTSAPLNHPGATVGYRIDLGGRSVAYVTDCEPRGTAPAAPPDFAVVGLASGADVLIHDAQYTDDEYPAKIGWGHSPTSYVVDLALAAGVRRLYLFHHDPLRDDTQIDALVEAARARATQAGGDLEIEAAAEGTSLHLPAAAAAPALTAAG
ncbi:MAG TPA: MBL fold metallo-hydrolase [Chloroflexota bacterium]|nr:MBL fold metallo-hydrolase [Chloroflexota bacterium]